MFVKKNCFCHQEHYLPLCAKVLKILCTERIDYHGSYILYKRGKFLTFIRQDDSKYSRNAKSVHVDWNHF